MWEKEKREYKIEPRFVKQEKKKEGKKGNPADKNEEKGEAATKADAGIGQETRSS